MTNVIDDVRGDPMPAPSQIRNRPDAASSAARAGRTGPAPTARRTRRRLLGAVLTVAGATGLLLSSVERATAQSAPSPRQQYDAADATVKAAQARVNELFQARRALDVEGTQLTTEQREVAKRLEEARAEAQRFVISTYIGGTGGAVEEAIIYQESTTDLSYKSFFLKDRAKKVQDAVEAQRSARR